MCKPSKIMRKVVLKQSKSYEFEQLLLTFTTKQIEGLTQDVA